MTKNDFMIDVEEKFLDCERLMYDSDMKHILNDTDSRIAFAAGYLCNDFKFMKTFFDVLISGYVPDIPF